MTTQPDFKAVIGQWPSPAVLAADVGAEPAAVWKWKERNRIPCEFWRRVIRAAKRRRFPSSGLLEDFARWVEPVD